MQTDEGDLLFTPNFLETPSLLTPDIVSNVSTIQSVYNPLHSVNENLSSSQSSSINTNETASSVSSADVKVLKIEDQLKQSFIEPRKPTPSPFEAISSGRNVFVLDKPIPVEDSGALLMPSTADVVTELEAITNTSIGQVKPTINESNEQEATTIGTVTLNNDPMRYDSPPPTKGTHVSPPKKTFLIRSQSHTEPPSPHSNNITMSQSQKTNLDNGILNNHNGLEIDGESIDGSINNSYARTVDLIPVMHSQEVIEQQFKSTIDNGNDQQHFNVPVKIEQNGHTRTIIKQQPVVFNNKRQLVNNVPPMAKANTIIIPQSSSLNEVTSTDQSSHVKRQRTAGLIPSNTTVMNFRPSYPSTGTTTVTNSPLNNNTSNGNVPDDQRKKQIRDSNREAARRCRERRRQYIEQLEGNLEHHKTQIKQLTEKLARIERENTQLRAILSETKILHTSRISLNDSHMDFANVISNSGIDIQSESTDGGIITGNYLNRTNL